MKLTFFKTLLFMLLFALQVQAQNNNLLAKVAYENAEAALESNNPKEGITELAKVDQLLGMLTPKSQYLRVHLWAKLTETNPLFVDSALSHSKNYLALASTFDIIEAKQLEIARLLQKLEKTKAAADEKAEAELACKEKIKKMDAEVPTRDQSRIAFVTGFNWDKDIVKQLKEADRIKGGFSKFKSAFPGYYVNKGEYYQFQVPGLLHGDISSKTKGYRIKGVNKDIEDKGYVTTASGAFQSMSATVTLPAGSAPELISAFNDLLGFQPDITYNVPESKTPMTQWYWWFSDYTVFVTGWPLGSTHYYYSISVDRHYPSEAKGFGKAPFMNCK